MIPGRDLRLPAAEWEISGGTVSRVRIKVFKNQMAFAKERTVSPSVIMPFLLVFLVFVGRAASAMEVEPLCSLRLLGGGHSFAGERGSFSGNAAFLLAPAMRLDDRWALMPVVESAYQGTKQATELAGAGTLFQEEMDHKGKFLAVYSRPGSPWRIKPSLGYRVQLLKETKGESWSKGLFDNHVLSLGLEAEWARREAFSARFAYDYAYTFFPNYLSLESQMPAGLSREPAGSRVLDSHSNMGSVSLALDLGGGAQAETSLRLMQRLYSQQHLAEPSGLLAGETREDFLTSWTGGARLPLRPTGDWRVAASLDLSAENLASNQGSYDARRVRHLPGFYDYVRFSAAPGVRVSYGEESRPVVLSLTGSWAWRRWPHRPVQDSYGGYQGDSLRQRTWQLGASLSYPLARRMSLLFDAKALSADSNQGYQVLYRYDYSAANYLFGFSYDY